MASHPSALEAVLVGRVVGVVRSLPLDTGKATAARSGAQWLQVCKGSKLRLRWAVCDASYPPPPPPPGWLRISGARRKPVLRKNCFRNTGYFT